ncbi:hypothetical protein OJF2_44240 [Aquisphaera giovannonii]|uniref:Uncharacterized protein n=1 Tax=Aquisphaera giovannonii TaxID=406548 RepID=A0A5B9W6A8_9BACT|nr:hypothetical protein [Aquisphaera giovannonii]QEH35867.1 hypothetical protein OJF2_44240 [Aquisphaera giovannonii]
MPRRVTIGALAAATLAMAISAAPGCGGPAGGGYAPTADEALALTRGALDAWSSGKAADLSRRDPPLRFVDPVQARGWALLEYRILEGEHRQAGPVVDVPVELSVKPPKGKPQPIRAVYQVATHPSAAVLRNDPD